MIRGFKKCSQLKLPIQIFLLKATVLTAECDIISYSVVKKCASIIVEALPHSLKHLNYVCTVITKQFYETLIWFPRNVTFWEIFQGQLSYSDH